MAEDPRKNDNSLVYVKEALKWQYNLIGIAGAAAFAAISGSGLPLLLAAGLELMYLSTVPQNSRFRRLVRSWKYDADKRTNEARLSQMFHELPPEMRTRFAGIDKMCRSIKANYAKLSSTSQIFLGQIDSKLNNLLQAYIRMLHGAHQHREYLRNTDPESIKREIATLQRTLESEAQKVQEINRKRIEILGKRLDKFNKIRENRQVIDAQCAAIEDVLELIRDQSVTLRDPQQVSDQLEHLVTDVEHTEQAVKDVEAIYELALPETAGSPLLADSASQPSRGRSRLRT